MQTKHKNDGISVSMEMPILAKLSSICHEAWPQFYFAFLCFGYVINILPSHLYYMADQIPKANCFSLPLSLSNPLKPVLSWEWRCSWSSADRRCSNYIWVINNFIAYWVWELYYTFDRTYHLLLHYLCDIFTHVLLSWPFYSSLQWEST